MSAHYLEGLNAAQLKAVEHPPDVPLQILAGPGSGKTRVLTSRIAHFILHHATQPGSLCAVTFTNKAANEMRVRLHKLVGKPRTDEIQLGTFHSLCARFLRRHSDKVGIGGNFTICDAEESKKILKKLLEPYVEELVAQGLEPPEVGSVASRISKAKTKGLTPRDLLAEISKQQRPDTVSKVVAQVYDEYQHALRQSNSLDFDDLLVRGVQLFRDYPDAAGWCKHILVDEFQDTNTVQYELMWHIAAANKCVTIVGDPDQSIYGWRSAEVENLRKMSRDFHPVAHILLEQNYRSTGAILAASVAIVAEDKKRMPKTLYTAHPPGSRPLLQAFASADGEGAFVASEVKRLIAYTGGMLDFNDFAILLRYNALSRLIERELQKEGIPNRIIGGRKFFERLEVKDVLAYLQIVDNPHFVPAFTRVINVPSRGIGPKTIDQILLKAMESKLSPMEVAERIYDGRIPDTKPAVKRKLMAFVSIVRLVRQKARQGDPPSLLIPQLLEAIDYQEHLKKTQSDWEERWMNVMELLNFAAETQSQIIGQNQPASSQLTSQAGTQTTEGDPMEDTPLRLFLQASMLSTDAEDNKDDKTPAITIATCHAAKGLEWPVVFIPAVEKGTFPAARAEDPEEERRLLYVACTRAQSYLTLTHTHTRFMNGSAQPKDVSPFISCLKERVKVLFTERCPQVDTLERNTIAAILGRTPPDKAEVTRKVQEYDNQARQKTLFNSYKNPAPQSGSFGGVETPTVPQYEGPAVFTSAAATLRDYKPKSEGTQVSRSKSFISFRGQHSGSSVTGPRKKPASASGRAPSLLNAAEDLMAQPTIDLCSSQELERPTQQGHLVPRSNQLPCRKSLQTGKIAGTSEVASSSKDVIDLRSSSPEFFEEMYPRLSLVSNPGKIKLVPSKRRSTMPSNYGGTSTEPTVPVPTKGRGLRQSPGPIIDLTGSSSHQTLPSASTKATLAPAADFIELSSDDATSVKPGSKKRLGMGRTAIGYPNKKYKAPS